MTHDIVINARLSIPATEIRFTTSRASGPGGQHVNKADTRVELRWDVRQSTVLSEAQRDRIQEVLRSRINRRGELVLSSDTRRSQHRNRQEVVKKFAALLRRALAPRKRRRPTRKPQAAEEERLRRKRQQAERKHQRRRPTDEE
jgi:ribosome-associated protein